MNKEKIVNISKDIELVKQRRIMAFAFMVAGFFCNVLMLSDRLEFAWFPFVLCCLLFLFGLIVFVDDSKEIKRLEEKLKNE